MRKSEAIFSVILIPIDFIMLNLAALTAYYIRIAWIAEYRPVLFSQNLPLERYIELSIVVSIFWLCIFALAGLYKLKSAHKLLQEFFQVVISSCAGIMGVIIYIFISREWFDSRFILLTAWVLSIFYVIFGRILIRQLQRFLIKKYQFGIHKILVIGTDSISQKIIKEIQSQPEAGYQIVKHLSRPNISEVKSAVGNPGIDEVILADPNYPREEILNLIDVCNDCHLGFKFVPNLFQSLTTNIGVDVFSRGIPLIELKRTSLDGWGRIIKRAIDVLFSFIGLFILFPFFLIIAFLIKWDSDGPVFVRLKRISQGKVFYIYKFRSMVKNAEELKKYLWRFNERKDGPLFKMKNDPRVTRFGRILRKYRIDELPQLINVLKGEMSLIGPRPHQPDEVSRYKKHHRKLLAIKPGMTGLAQINGSSDLPFEEEAKLDIYYIEHWSLLLDFKIFIKTLFILFIDTSAC